jgi:hypothetical protein
VEGGELADLIVAASGTGSQIGRDARGGIAISARPAAANTTLIAIAGVHYVVFDVSRRGLVALPTVRNISRVDN